MIFTNVSVNPATLCEGLHPCKGVNRQVHGIDDSNDKKEENILVFVFSSSLQCSLAARLCLYYLPNISCLNLKFIVCISFLYLVIHSTG